SKTNDGAIELRGRLFASTRLAMGVPSALLGAKEKSVSSLLSRKPWVIWWLPIALSMVVVMDTAFPSWSTMAMWVVPCSSAMSSGAYSAVVQQPGGLPATGTPIDLLMLMSVERWRR